MDNMEARQKADDEVYCRTCGAAIKREAEICPKCGVRQFYTAGNNADQTSGKWLTTLLLAIFLGAIGVHRFYVGKIGTGILMILTCWTGISEIWAIIDIIFIATSKFKDKRGNIIERLGAE
jgi:TM2 domain-containing membrane protein YozV/ribosomal protein L40E